MTYRLLKLIALSLVMSLSYGCSTISSNTTLDKENDFFLITSYGWVDTAEDGLDQELREVIEETMQARGYDPTEADYADIWLHSGFYISSEPLLKALDCSPSTENSASGEKNVWMVAMISPMTECEVWQGTVQATPEQFASENEATKEEAAELLEDFPPEHSTMDYIKALMQYLFGSADED